MGCASSSSSSSGPLLREVSFEGNSEIKTEDLREKAAIRVGILYNPVEVQKAEEAIRLKYEDEGFFGVQITPRTERTPEGDLRVVFRIEEGPKLHIDKIVIEGNKALTAGQIKDAMSTKERLYWIFPFSTVQRKVFDDDVDRIIQLYADHGFIQARVESTEIVPDLARKKVTLHVRVVEGPQFRTGTITITGNELLSTEEIQKMVTLQEGGVFSRGALRQSARAIIDRYSELGRARADVDPRTVYDTDNLKVDVTHPDRRGRAGLRRADQHHRQHEELGEDPAPGAARVGGRAVHVPEAGAEPPAPLQPRLLRRGDGQHRAGIRAGQDRHQHRREGEGDGRLQHRGGLQQPRQHLRHPRREPAEPVRPGPGGVPPDPLRLPEPARPHRVHRALPLRHPAAGGLRHLRPGAGLRRFHRGAPRR